MLPPRPRAILWFFALVTACSHGHDTESSAPVASATAASPAVSVSVPRPPVPASSPKAPEVAQPMPPATPGPLVYTSDEQGGFVVVVDPRAAAVVARVPVGKRPRGLKLSKDGRLLYVAVSGSPRAGPGMDESKLPPGDRKADGIAVLDLATRTLVRTLPGGQDPESFDFSPDGKTLYISNEETAEMSALDVDSGTVRARVGVGKQPEGVTVRPDGAVVFVTSEEDNEVSAVDTKTLKVIATMKTALRPRSVVFTKDGHTAFVTDEFAGKLTVIDAVKNEPAGEIELHEDSPTHTGPRPMGEVLSPDGKRLYVTCGRGASVAIVDVASRKQVRSFDGVGDRPWGIAITPDGSHLYTANGTSADLAIVDVATGNVDKRVHIGGLPWGVALSR